MALILLAVLLCAQGQAVEWPIESLAVEGNRLYTKSQVLDLAGLKVGQKADKPQFDQARDRLVESGAFESVGYRFAPSASGKGYAVTFEVAEMEQVYPLRFEDLPATDEELKAWLRQNDPLFGEKIPTTQRVLDRYVRLTEQFLANKNEKEKLVARVTADTPEDLYVLIRPAAMAPVVAEVRFEGNQVIPNLALGQAIHGVAVGVPYRELRFRQLLDTSVRPLYEERGRVRVSFPRIETREAPSVKGLVVTVHVEEGESYNLGDVRVEGVPSLSNQLLEAANFKTGDVANFEEVEAGVERIKTAMKNRGHLKVETEIDRVFQDKKKEVDLTVHVKPGPEYSFGSLRIKGLDLHGEAALKKMWGLPEGKPFNAGYPDFFLNRIREDGIFDNLGKTRSEVKVNEESRRVEVTLVFY